MFMILYLDKLSLTSGGLLVSSSSGGSVTGSMPQKSSVIVEGTALMFESGSSCDLADLKKCCV